MCMPYFKRLDLPLSKTLSRKIYEDIKGDKNVENGVVWGT